MAALACIVITRLRVIPAITGEVNDGHFGPLQEPARRRPSVAKKQRLWRKRHFVDSMRRFNSTNWADLTKRAP